MGLSTTIKALQDIMRKDAGIDGDAQRIGQLGWLLFLKIYSDLELQAEFLDESYASPLPERLRWASWADQDALGKDAPTGDALLELVDQDLFPTLKGLDLDSLTSDTRARGELLRSVFEDAFNYMKNGTLLRQVINKLNVDVNFNESTTRHVFGDIYEQILRDLQGAGNAGEFYTPRAATSFAVEMIDPKLGEIVLDPACGTGGFLTGTFEHVRRSANTPDDLELLKSCIRGVEKKSLPHLLCTTNMMIHGIEVPSHIRHGNALARPLRDYGPGDQVDIVLTNPPFGGMEEDGVENNFPAEFRTRETADLFLVLVMELLKEGGRAAIVLPDGTLFGEGMKSRIKERLLRDCNLHTIVRLPAGVFAPYTSIKTNLLFFTKGEPTKEIWFFEHPYPAGYKNYSKTKPMRIEEFDLEKSWWTNRIESEHAWKVDVEDVIASGYDLDVKNPHEANAHNAHAGDLLLALKDAAAELSALQAGLAQKLAASIDATLPGVPNLLEHVGVMCESSDGTTRLRDLVLELAVRGRLSRTLESDGDAELDLRTVGEQVSPSGVVEPIPQEGPWPIPDTWRWTRLKDVIDFTPGKTPPTKDGSYWPVTGEGYPWAAIGDMPESGTLLTTQKKVSESAVRDVMKRPPAAIGTILMSFKLTIGKVCRVGVPTYFNEAIVSISAPSLVLGEFLFRTLPLLAPQGRSRAAIKGATLNNSSISNILVPFPPLTEQGRIVATLDELFGLIDGVAQGSLVRTELNRASAAALVREVLGAN